MKHTHSIVALALMSALSSAHTEAREDSVSKALSEGKTNVMFRYRMEGVDQDGLPENALANTVLSRLSYTSGKLGKMTAKIEFDYVTELFDKDYNDTINGATDYPVIADPSGSDLNQFYLKYAATEDTSVTFGRQRINHDKQRFIGGVAWRQNEQTYDGLRVESSISENLTMDYAYIYRVNRIFGSRNPNGDLSSNMHLFNAVYAPGGGHRLSGFAYIMDFDDALALSNETFGFDYRYKGKFENGSYNFHASYATQSDAGDNPVEYDTDYFALEADVTFSGFTLGAGMESLGGDNGKGFQTPLATLHIYQGFADKFLGTPGQGIEDTYIKAGTKIGPVKLTAWYHQFDSEQGSVDYGDEINFLAVYPISKKYSMLFKYASYTAEEVATDTDKFWVQFVAKY